MQGLRALNTYADIQAGTAYAFVCGPGRLGSFLPWSFLPLPSLSYTPEQSSRTPLRGARRTIRGTSLRADDRDSTGQPWDISSWEAPADSSRWEKLWLNGEKEKQKTSFWPGMADSGNGDIGETGADMAMPVEVVSFDLDDTLWSTKGVIEAANKALQEHLQREHPALTKKCEIADLMKEIWKERMVANPTLDPTPVNLTELRKAGLSRACEIAGVDPLAAVESSFSIWRKARHDVQPFLFPGVLETLEALRDRGLRLVAITNGNAQTSDIPCLQNLFEFCVMAEEVGERKPQSGPFREAVKRAGYPSEDHVGGEWVHVGDDWATDCVGGKAMRMRTILVRVPGKPKLGELSEVDVEEEQANVIVDDGDEDREYPVLEDHSTPDTDRLGAARQASNEREKAKQRTEQLGLLGQGDFEVAMGTAAVNRGKELPKDKRSSTTSIEETMRAGDKVRAAAQSVDSRNLGSKVAALAMDDRSGLRGSTTVKSTRSSSYVTDMLMQDFMDANLDNISEVLDVVDQWNAAASQFECFGQGATDEAAQQAAGIKPPETAASTTAAAPEESNKFCMECGVTIPFIAKFCPACGTKQEAAGNAML